jgi:hypothetical protein
MLSNQYSPLLVDGLAQGTIDAALFRREKGAPGLASSRQRAFDGDIA